MENKNKSYYNLKKIAVSLPLIIGGILFINSFFSCSMNLWAGSGYLFTGFGLTIFFVRWLLRGDLDFTSGGVMVSVGFVLGIISLLTGSKVLDPAYNKLRVDIYSVFVEASLTCKGDSQPYINAARSCGVAPILDVMDLNYQLAKARYLNPTASIVDGVYHSTDDVKVDPCLVNYYELSSQCPDAFVQLKNNHPELKSSASFNQCSSLWLKVRGWIGRLF